MVRRARTLAALLLITFFGAIVHHPAGTTHAGLGPGYPPLPDHPQTSHAAPAPR